MSLDDVLAELKKTYLEALPARATLIESLHQNKQYAEVEVEFHKLKGTGKTYGIPEVSQIGELAEKLCETGGPTADEAIVAALNALRSVSKTRAGGSPLDTATDKDFLRLSDLAKRA
jgi:HPt (histidine-containing phosphotransfer) domain-containing protein